MDSRDWQRQLHGFARPLAKIVLTVFLGMLVFELVQSLLWPDQSPWQSHAAEVIYAATLASVVGYFALRMHTVLYQQVLEENEKYEKSEETLRRNKEWFRSLTEHGSDLITVIDPKGIILYDSPSIERILGYRPIDRQGKSGFDLVHPEDIPGAKSIIERAFQKLGSTHTVAMRVRGLDGRWHVLEATCKTMLDHDGKLRGIINSRDITERKEAEKKLLRSEAKFQTLFESNSDAVMLLDGKSFLDCNKAALAIFGCATREEFCSKHPADLSPLEQPCGTSSMMLANQRIATAMEKGSHRFEWVHKRADTGKTFSADVLLSVMELDGKPVLQATVRDITERKQAHQAIKVLAKFPEQNPHPILRVAQDGTLLYANAASHALLETWHCLPEKPIPEWWRNLVVRALASGQPHTTEVEIGGLVYFFTIVPIADEGYANIYASDITERKQAEAAVQHANRALATLSAVNRTLVRAANEDELLQAICQAIVEQRGYRLAWVGYKQHDESKSLKIMARAGHDEGYLDTAQISWAEIEHGMGPSGRAIRSGTTQLCQDIANDPQYIPWRDAALKCGHAASIALPLLNESNTVFGILNVYAGEANAFTPNEIDLLEEMAGDLAFGVRSLHTRRERDLALVKNQQHLAQLKDSLEDTVRAMAGLVEMRDPYTAGHQARVADLAAAIAKQMGLPEEQVHAIHLAGTVHDLGKIKIPAEILSKPGKITDLEFGLIKVHPQAGYDILKGINFPWPIAPMVLQHHEWFGGSGYSARVKGAATPV